MILHMADRALSELPIPRARIIYPWGDWMDGSTWLLERGVDFFATVISFRNRCHARATDVGLNATVNVITLPAAAVREARAWLGGLAQDKGSTGTIFELMEQNYEGGWDGFLAAQGITIPSLATVLKDDEENWKFIVRVRFYDGSG